MAEIIVGIRGLDGKLHVTRAELPPAVAKALARSGTLRVHVADGRPQFIDHENSVRMPLVDRRQSGS